MLIQTYKRLVSRRGSEQRVMHAYWGPVEVQMTRSWCSARLSGPRVGALNILSSGMEVIWVCLFVCLVVNQHPGTLPWVHIQRPCCLSNDCDGGRGSLESERIHSACAWCVFVIPAPSLSFFFSPPRCVWMPRALTGIFTHNEVTPYHPPPPCCQLYTSTSNWEENGRVTPPWSHRTGRNVLVSTGAVWLGTDQNGVPGVWTRLLFEEPSSVPSSAAFTPNVTHPMP